jgi:hypothetical protein
VTTAKGEGGPPLKGPLCISCLYAAEQRPSFLEVSRTSNWNKGGSVECPMLGEAPKKEPLDKVT